MGASMRYLLMIFALCCSVSTQAAEQCGVSAVKQAQALLAFHAGVNEQSYIDPKVKYLSPMVNPVNSQQRFQVVAVTGFIYKAQYHMQFLYYPIDDDCVLMGQSIIEYASL